VRLKYFDNLEIIECYCLWIYEYNHKDSFCNNDIIMCVYYKLLSNNWKKLLSKNSEFISKFFILNHFNKLIIINLIFYSIIKEEFKIRFDIEMNAIIDFL